MKQGNCQIVKTGDKHLCVLLLHNYDQSNCWILYRILTGCGQKWGIVRHYEGQLCGKKDQLCDKLCCSQFLISNVLEGAKWCFDWYFSLFRCRINISTWNNISCFILVSNRPKTMSHISSRKNTHSNLTFKNWIAWGYVCNSIHTFFSEISPQKSACVL